MEEHEFDDVEHDHEQEALEAEEHIQANLAEVRQIISQAALKSGRTAEDITILAITKHQELEVMVAAYNCGLKNFGESYLQEALEKMEDFAEVDDIRWDMVGHVQSRKAKDVAEHFHTVHSLDSLKLARLLSANRPAELPALEVFLEVNLGNEETKSGLPIESEQDLAGLTKLAEEVQQMEGLKLVGLMGMPPLFDDPEKSRPYFQKLKQAQDYLNNQNETFDLKQISAGTSHDFAVAIEEGSTIIRLGEALLGPRNY